MQNGLQGIINAIAGTAANTAYTFPGANIGGAPTVSIGQTFKQFFSSLSNTAPFAGTFAGMGVNGGGGRGIPGAGFGIGGAAIGIPGAAGGYPGIGYPTQAYTNALAQISGGNIKHNKAQAFAPGSSVLSATATIPPPQAFQGFAGQAGAYQQPQFGNLPPGSYYPNSPLGMTQSNSFGKLQFLLGPVIGIFSAVRSLFDLKGIRSMKPVTVNREDLQFAGYQRSIAEIKREEGSFDEYYPETEEKENGMDFGGFQTF